MKTKKALAKRMRVTRRGKMLVRYGGQNHFRAKTSRKKQLNKKGLRDPGSLLNLKTLHRYLPVSPTIKK